MDRRRFAKLIVAAVVGVRVADELLPAANDFVAVYPFPDTGGGYFVHEDFADALKAELPWPPLPITDEQIADAVVDVADHLYPIGSSITLDDGRVLTRRA